MVRAWRKCSDGVVFSGIHVTRDLLSLGRRLYYEKGPSYTIWWFLKQVCAGRRRLVRFEDIYRFHQAIAGVKSKNATWKILKRLELYGLIEDVNGWYKPVIFDESIVKGSIDWRRVRTRDQVIGSSTRKQSAKKVVEKLPKPVQRVVAMARQLIEQGKKWQAVDLLAHTLVGVRETGVLVARKGDTFIYYEKKTSKMHMVKSSKLAEIFEQLGIHDEILTCHKQHDAGNIIRRMYGSHDVARRIHYLLKEQGWFEYPRKHYYYRYFEDPVSKTWCIIIYVRRGNTLEEVWRIQQEQQQEGLMIQRKAGTIVTREHVKEDNEETYFNRSKGLF